MFELRDKYNISKTDIIFCDVARFLHKSDKVPGEVKKRSVKKYGRKDNIGRYWYERYRNIPVGKYTYGYEDFGRDTWKIREIGSFCSIAYGQHIVSNDHHLDMITTHPIIYHKDFGFIESNAEYCGKVIIGNDVWIGANSIIFQKWGGGS